MEVVQREFIVTFYGMMMIYKNTYCGSRLNKMPMLVGIECVLTINPFMGNEISQTPEYVSAYFAFI